MGTAEEPRNTQCKYIMSREWFDNLKEENKRKSDPVENEILFNPI